MAEPIGMIRDQESRVTTFCFTLYCADTGHNTGRKTFEKEFFFISHIIMRRKWANNIKKKKEKKKKKAQSQKHHHHTLALSTHRLGQKEPGGQDPYGLALLGFWSTRSPPVACWNLRRTVLTTRHKAQTIWIVLAWYFPSKDILCLKHGDSLESWNVQRAQEVWEWNLYQFDDYFIREKRPSMCISDATRTALSLQENIRIFPSYIRIF